MKYQDVFKRYEIKYLLDKDQTLAVLETLNGRMELDEYGKTSIRNIYYDTPSCQLIRRSIEKPVYKEKLRVRSYGDVDEHGRVFVEIKKKYEDVVYKRRIALEEHLATEWLNANGAMPDFSQIAYEIEYFINFYEGLQPTCYLSYDRQAFKDLSNNGYRLTLDNHILARTSDLTLISQPSGTLIVPEEMTLMEFKTPSSMPLWLVKCIEENKIPQVSFSKYGQAYKEIIYKSIGVH